MAGKVIAMQTKLLAVFSSGVSVSVTQLCAELDISRQTLYKYRRRWEVEGPEGLVERSRRPHSTRSVISGAMEEAIVRLRKELPLECGAKTIRYHLVSAAGAGKVVPSVAAIHRLLVRRGMVVAQPEKRPRSAWRRFEWPRPNDAWQIDATRWVLADGTETWIMDVLDDHSRVLVAARVADGPTSRAAWEAFADGVAHWGVPARMMSDNGVCFTGRFLNGTEADFERQLRQLGIEHLLSSPGHPQTCGKIERSHQTTKGWLRKQPPIETSDELQDRLDAWRRYYNTERPHSACKGTTPLRRWLAQPPAVPGPPLPEPTQAKKLKVSSGGKISWQRYHIAVDSRLAGQTVLVLAQDLELAIYGQAGLIRRLRIDTTRNYQPNGHPPGRRARRIVSDV
jgi:transposase InsO family protein